MRESQPPVYVAKRRAERDRIATVATAVHTHDDMCKPDNLASTSFTHRPCVVSIWSIYCCINHVNPF
jgi:hypothetical protein